jgi:hypothetical protein
MMAIPSPGAFLSPKTETESTGSVSVEQPSLELFTAFAACGLESAVKVESSFADGTSDISAALAMRTLAVYAGCLRHGQIGCALMPLAEFFGFNGELELSALLGWMHLRHKLSGPVYL